MQSVRVEERIQIVHVAIFLTIFTSSFEHLLHCQSEDSLSHQNDHMGHFNYVGHRL
jgi:hypothetical protein